jgi:alkylhydroperoxidase family enzyme
LTEETIQKMRHYEESDLSEREKMALRFADIILTDPQKLDEAFFKQLKEHFTEEQIIDMGMGVGFLHGTQRFIESMGIVPESYDEGAHCELPFESRL